MAGCGQAARDGKNDLAADRRADVSEREREEEADVTVLVDERDEEMLECFHRSILLWRPTQRFAATRAAGSRPPDFPPRPAGLRRGRSARSRGVRPALRPRRRSCERAASPECLPTAGPRRYPACAGPRRALRARRCRRPRAGSECRDRALRAMQPADARHRCSTGCDCGTLVRRDEARAARPD